MITVLFAVFLQAHASAAVVNFSEGADQEMLPAYLDTLITKLLVSHKQTCIG